jgi:uncharacterized membrane protein YhaH (DUF805 family)
MFGFNARLGRLHYFLASLGLGIMSFLVFFVLAFGAAVAHSPSNLYWPVLVLIGLALWANAMLQSMRFRDIGWDPVCILPLWFASMAVDYVVANRFPDWALTHTHSGTIVGGLINLGLSLALLFWPSGDIVDGDGDGWADHAPRPTGRTSATASESRLARVSGGDFGRRVV